MIGEPLQWRRPWWQDDVWNVNVREELQSAEEGNPRAARPGNQTARPDPAQFVSKISQPGPIGPGRRAARPVQSSSTGNPSRSAAFHCIR